MKTGRARKPKKESKAGLAPQEMARRLWRCSERPDGFANTMRLLAQGADPQELCRPAGRFLRHDDKCWLMRIAAMADGEALGAAWSAVQGRPVASPQKLLAACFICAWRADVDALTPWLARAWKELGSPSQMLEEALLSAANASHPKALKVFLTLAPKDCAHRPLGRSKKTLWMSAAHSASMARALMDFGADPEARDEKGRTALLVAASQGWEDGVRFLSSVSDPRARDVEGRGLADCLAGARGPARQAIEEALALAEALDLREAAQRSAPSRPRISL